MISGAAGRSARSAPAAARPVPSAHPTQPGASRPGRPRTLAGDRGSGTIELVILTPLVLLMVFGVISGGFWLHGRSIALAAANQGLVAARAESSDSAQGAAAAQGFVDRAGAGVLTGVVVDVDRDPATVRVTVTASTVSFLPGIPGLRIQQTAQGPVERVTGS